LLRARGLRFALLCTFTYWFGFVWFCTLALRALPRSLRFIAVAVRPRFSCWLPFSRLHSFSLVLLPSFSGFTSARSCAFYSFGCARFSHCITRCCSAFSRTRYAFLRFVYPGLVAVSLDRTGYHAFTPRSRTPFRGSGSWFTTTRLPGMVSAFLTRLRAHSRIYTRAVCVTGVHLVTSRFPYTPTRRFRGSLHLVPGLRVCLRLVSRRCVPPFRFPSRFFLTTHYVVRCAGLPHLPRLLQLLRPVYYSFIAFIPRRFRSRVVYYRWFTVRFNTHHGLLRATTAAVLWFALRNSLVSASLHYLPRFFLWIACVRLPAPVLPHLHAAHPPPPSRRLRHGYTFTPRLYVLALRLRSVFVFVLRFALPRILGLRPFHAFRRSFAVCARSFRVASHKHGLWLRSSLFYCITLAFWVGSPVALTVLVHFTRIRSAGCWFHLRRSLTLFHGLRANNGLVRTRGYLSLTVRMRSVSFSLCSFPVWTHFSVCITERVSLARVLAFLPRFHSPFCSSCSLRFGSYLYHTFGSLTVGSMVFFATRVFGLVAYLGSARVTRCAHLSSSPLRCAHTPLPHHYLFLLVRLFALCVSRTHSSWFFGSLPSYTQTLFCALSCFAHTALVRYLYSVVLHVASFLYGSFVHFYHAPLSVGYTPLPTQFVLVYLWFAARFKTHSRWHLTHIRCWFTLWFTWLDHTYLSPLATRGSHVLVRFMVLLFSCAFLSRLQLFSFAGLHLTLVTTVQAFSPPRRASLPHSLTSALGRRFNIGFALSAPSLHTIKCFSPRVCLAPRTATRGSYLTTVRFAVARFIRAADHATLRITTRLPAPFSLLPRLRLQLTSKLVAFAVWLHAATHIRFARLLHVCTGSLRCGCFGSLSACPTL